MSSGHLLLGILREEQEKKLGIDLEELERRLRLAMTQ